MVECPEEGYKYAPIIKYPRLPGYRCSPPKRDDFLERCQEMIRQKFTLESKIAVPKDLSALEESQAVGWA